jgi:acetyl-CoA acyltransferase
MGQTAENLARQYEVTREEQDAFALRSHQRAAAAQDAGKFDDEIVPLEVEITLGEGGSVQTYRTTFDRDEGVRRDSSAEALAKLRPVFHAQGTVTAGNSSQTSDGAAAVLVMSEEKAERLGLAPMARFRSFAVGGVAPELMGIGPVTAVPKALKLAGVSLDEIDLVELNEAFAVQALACVRELSIDLERMNIDGGAIAIGHPLGATGARITGKAAQILRREDKRYALATQCIGGGQGISTVLEAA